MVLLDLVEVVVVVLRVGDMVGSEDEAKGRDDKVQPKPCHVLFRCSDCDSNSITLATLTERDGVFNAIMTVLIVYLGC